MFPLPPFFLLTDRRRVADPLPLLERLPPGSAVVLRDYDAPDRAVFGQRLRAACWVHHLRFLVAGDTALAHRLRADGVHLPEWQIPHAPAIRRDFPAGLITAAAHSLPALRRLDPQLVDAAFLSPVFATASHPETRPLGALRLRQWAAQSAVPVYALGGITSATRFLLRDAPIAGTAAVSAIPEQGGNGR